MKALHDAGKTIPSLDEAMRFIITIITMKITFSKVTVIAGSTMNSLGIGLSE